jgi:putative hemolysin
MAALGRLPTVGDEIQVDGYRLAVAEVDGRRAARIRVTPPPAAEPTASDAPSQSG